MRVMTRGPVSQPLSQSENMHKPDFSGIITKVEILGYDKNPDWTRDNEGLKIKTKGIDTDKPVVFKIYVD